MADDLSAPLGRKRAAKDAAPRFQLSVDKIPLARIAFGLAAVVIVGVVARIVFVNDPMGGRPVAEIGVNGTHGANALAKSLTTSASQATKPNTIVECPRENQRPTETGRLPSAMSLRVVLSIAAM